MGRMLTVDPERRATIPQIRKHAWLRTCAAAAATTTAAAAADSERAAACMTATASAQATDSLLAGMAYLGLAQPPGAASSSC